jgi:hypothetical protein
MISVEALARIEIRRAVREWISAREHARKIRAYNARVKDEDRRPVDRVQRLADLAELTQHQAEQRLLLALRAQDPEGPSSHQVTDRAWEPIGSVVDATLYLAVPPDPDERNGQARVLMVEEGRITRP